MRVGDKVTITNLSEVPISVSPGPGQTLIISDAPPASPMIGLSFVHYTETELAARKEIIAAIEEERRIFHERIEPLFKQLGEIPGTVCYLKINDTP